MYSDEIKKQLDARYEPDACFTEEDFLAWGELTSAIRNLMDSSVKLRVRKHQLAALTEKVTNLNHEFEEALGNRPVPAYAGFHADRVPRSQPFCPIMGELNPLAAPLDLFYEDKLAVGAVIFGELYQGPPNCVHGGVIAETWDLVLAYANTVHDVAGPTAYLNISYRNLTPLHKPLRFEARMERCEGKKIFTKGVCYCDGVVLTEAEAMFINTTEHMSAMDAPR